MAEELVSSLHGGEQQTRRLFREFGGVDRFMNVRVANGLLEPSKLQVRVRLRAQTERVRLRAHAVRAVREVRERGLRAHAERETEISICTDGLRIVSHTT